MQGLDAYLADITFHNLLSRLDFLPHVSGAAAARVVWGVVWSRAPSMAMAGVWRGVSGQRVMRGAERAAVLNHGGRLECLGAPEQRQA